MEKAVLQVVIKYVHLKGLTQLKSKQSSVIFDTFSVEISDDPRNGRLNMITTMDIIEKFHHIVLEYRRVKVLEHWIIIDCFYLSDRIIFWLFLKSHFIDLRQ